MISEVFSFTFFIPALQRIEPCFPLSDLRRRGEAGSSEAPDIKESAANGEGA